MQPCFRHIYFLYLPALWSLQLRCVTL